MKVFSLIYIFLNVFQISFLFAQNDTQIFKAFGVNPSVPNDSLFKNIANAKNLTERVSATNQLIQFHEVRGNLDSVVFYGNRLYVEISETNSINKENYLAKAALATANGKYTKGLYDEALKWYLKGIAHSKASQDKALLLENQLGLGSVKVVRGNADEGIAIVKACAEKATNPEQKHDAYKQLGNIMFNTGNFKESRTYYKKANVFYGENGFLKKKLETNLFLARLLEVEGKTDDALSTYFQVFDQALINNFFVLYAKAGNDIGALYLKQGDFDNAQKILSTVYINAVQWGNIEIEKQAIFSLQKAHAQTGDFKNAYALMTQFVRVNNDILNNQNKQQVNELEVQYKTLQQQQEISRQKTIKISLLVGFIIILIPVLGVLYMYYQKLQTQSRLNKIQEEINAQKIAALLRGQELKLVKASLEGQEQERKRISKELHDGIGGNLATIKLQLSNQEAVSSQVIQQVDDTYNQVRELSHDLMPKRFQNTAFTFLLLDYVDNIRNHSEEKINLQIHSESAINALPETLKAELFKIVQELLTNTLKHAKASQIDIQLSIFDNDLKLLFEDDGVGFNKAQVKYGLGLSSISDRLKILKGRIFIDAFPGRGTVVDVDVPIKNEE
ncbi:MAG: ATP-binding protein [Flavobacteriaceae bacterium]